MLRWLHKIYLNVKIYMTLTLLFHWIIAYCKTHRRAEFHQHEPIICSHKSSYCLFVYCRAHNAGGQWVRELCTTFLELGVPLGDRYLNYWKGSYEERTTMTLICWYIFLALRIGTRCLPVISLWVYPPYSQRSKDESRGKCIFFLDLGWPKKIKLGSRCGRGV